MSDIIASPMLAATLTDITQVIFPVLCTPKIDGIRCLKRKGDFVSRSFKKIPNNSIREALAKLHLPNNVDGELIVENERFAETSSFVMSADKIGCKVMFCIFDIVTDSLQTPYEERMKDLQELKTITTSSHKGTTVEIIKLLPIQCNQAKDLKKFKEEVLHSGFEGVILRSPTGAYKCGRSTLKSGTLLKWKDFIDEEARVIGFSEANTNENEKRLNELGKYQRAHKSEFKKNAETLGSLIVQTIDKPSVTFNIGTGFTQAQRKEIWTHQHKYLGKLVKYKYFEKSKDMVPRFPSFIGFRDEKDLV